MENILPSENIPLKKYKHLIPASPVIIDCGAHIGADTLKLARLKGSTVHAFEAAPQIFSQLKEHTKNISNIICYPLALAHKTGTASFHISTGASDGSSSLLAPKQHLASHPDVYFTETVLVDVITLDDWAMQNNIPKVDVLWLDMQGAEQMMLSVSTKILPTVQLIHTEVSTIETYEGVVTYEAYKTFLAEKGFEEFIKAVPKGYDMGNVIFKRKNSVLHKV